MSTPPEPLLTARAALVLLIAAVVGIVAGSLGYLAYGGFAVSALVGGGAAGGALALFHAVLAR